MKKLFLILSAFGCMSLFSQCEDQDQAAPVDAFLARWYSINCGYSESLPYGDLYQWPQMPSCPTGYHVATSEEYEKLCTYPSVFVNNGPHGTNGRWYCPSNEAINNPSTAKGCVFFPAGGQRKDSTNGTSETNGQYSEGYYWSSTVLTGQNKWVAIFYFDNEEGGGVYSDFWEVLPDRPRFRYARSFRCIKDE